MVCNAPKTFNCKYLAYTSVACVCLLSIMVERSSGADSLQILPIVFADILPPGHRGIVHEIVFVESDLLEAHRLIATPLRGFHGVEEIRPGQPFPFSTKYGTRFYVVPEDAALPEARDVQALARWPSCDPPITEIRGVPWYSPVVSALSTCKLVDVSSENVGVELVNHDELDSNGEPASMVRRAFILGAIAAAGLLGCGVLYRRIRVRKSVEMQHSASETIS